MTGHVATARTEIQASPERVWEAMTDPAQVAEYMMGSQVESDYAARQPHHLERSVGGQGVPGQGRGAAGRARAAAGGHALQPAHRRGGRTGELPHGAL